MQHEFDNTFESLLRRVATRNEGEVLPENAAHLDADSISAFAENALPGTTRALFTSHLADCSDCRQILVNFASIQEAEESEIVETKAASPAQPTWSERFARWFALPNLGYAAAALTVLFVGVFAFVALQSRQEKQIPQVAQIEVEDDEVKAEQKRRRERTPPAQAEPTVESTPEVLQDVATNFAESENANVAENTNQNAEQSPNQGLPPSVRATRGQQSNSGEIARKEPGAVKESTRSTSVSNANAAGTAVSASPAPTPTAAAKSSPEKTVTLAAAPPNSSDAQKNPADQRQEAAESLNLRNQANPAGSAPKKLIAPRTIGNRTFQNLDGVWRDAAYSGQTTVMITRSSDEYKKLDGGLRSIADSFRGETVIVVWQGKAYRIR
jgi:hypothetical protein